MTRLFINLQLFPFVNDKQSGVRIRAFDQPCHTTAQELLRPSIDVASLSPPTGYSPGAPAELRLTARRAISRYLCFITIR